MLFVCLACLSVLSALASWRMGDRLAPPSSLAAPSAGTQQVTKERVVNLKLQEPTDFICPIHFQMALPKLDFDGIFMRTEGQRESFYKYRTSSLERHRKPPFATPFLGMDVDLVNGQSSFQLKSASWLQANAEKAATDYSLLSSAEDRFILDPKPSGVLSGAAAGAARRSASAAQTAQQQQQKQEGLPPSGRVGAIGQGLVRRSAADDDDASWSLEEKARRIEQTFVETGRLDEDPTTLRHPRNPALKAVAVLQLLPDLENWVDRVVEVRFAADPRHTDYRKQLQSTRASLNPALAFEDCLLVPSEEVDKRFEFLVPEIAEIADMQRSIGDGTAAEKKVQYLFSRELFVDRDVALQDALMLRRTDAGSFMVTPVASAISAENVGGRQLRARKRRAVVHIEPLTEEQEAWRAAKRRQLL